MNGRPFGSAVDLAALVLDRRPDGDELGHVRAPLVAPDLEPDANDAVGAELVGLLLHTGHGQLAGRVHGLGEDAHLLTGLPARLLIADVVDARAHHEADRLKAGLLHAQVLVHRQVRGEQPAGVHLEALAGVLGEALGAGRIVGRHERCSSSGFGAGFWPRRRG